MTSPHVTDAGRRSERPQPAPHRRRRHQRLMLVGVFVLFFLPVVAALVLRSTPGLLGSLSTTNHGELLDPPRQVQAQGLLPRAPADPALASFRDHWSAIVIDDGSCNPQCRAALYATRQAHIAMNKDMDRLHRFFVLVDTQAQPVPASERSGLVVADTPASWVRQFLPPGHSPQPGEAFLVDPRGFLFMRYAPGFEPGHLIQDLKRLLKISTVG